jgi:hypothetical protein
MREIEKSQSLCLFRGPVISLEAKMDSGFAAVNARIDSLEARLDLKLERWAVKLIIAMLVSQAALGPIGVGALRAVRQTLSTLVR